jgi:hypothetical protein
MKEDMYSTCTDQPSVITRRTKEGKSGWRRKIVSGSGQRSVDKREVMFSSALATGSTIEKWVHVKKDCDGFPMFFVIPKLTTSRSSPAVREPISIATLTNLPRKKRAMMQKANVSHGETKMDRMERRKELPCNHRFIESKLFVVRCQCQWKIKWWRRKEEAKKRIWGKGILMDFSNAAYGLLPPHFINNWVVFDLKTFLSIPWSWLRLLMRVVLIQRERESIKIYKVWQGVRYK